MLDKKVAIELYKQGYSYREIGEQFKVSKQRVHQVVKNYSHFGKRSRFKKYRNFGKCNECDEISVVLHHKDYDNSNDSIENLQPLCMVHHLQKHTFPFARRKRTSPEQRKKGFIDI